MTISPQEQGRIFEDEIAREFGLSRVPGSGNQWHQKLDLKGRLIRWSLKWTGAKSYRLTQEDVREAWVATQGVAGTGETPAIMVRLADDADYDLVILRKNDFVKLTEGELDGVMQQKVTGGQKRRETARVPVLLRGDQ